MDRERARALLSSGLNGIDEWNRLRPGRRQYPLKEWRQRKRAGERMPNLSSINLHGAVLPGVNLSRVHLCNSTLSSADLSGADLSGTNAPDADLRNACLNGATLVGAQLRGSTLRGASLRNANLSGATLVECDLSEADLTGATLEEADLQKAILVDACLKDANLQGSRVYGVSAWNVELDGANQENLILSADGDADLTIDNIDVAQFVYLLLHNQNIRRVIDSVTSKVVLILGRFTVPRKQVLEAIRKYLRRKNYCPVLFDFAKPASRDFIETVSTLAHMARFIIADFTDAKIVLEEVPHIARSVAVPILPLFQQDAGREPITLINARRARTTVLETLRYVDIVHLLSSLEEPIAVAEKKAIELTDR